jgi:hypothetical protein
MAAAHLIGGGTESLRRGAFAIVRAMGDGGVPPQVAAQLPGFDTALLAADTDLVSLADQLAAAPTLPACGILLAGPPGSGKSAFARHLADRLGLDPLLLRGSDLLADCPSSNALRQWSWLANGGFGPSGCEVTRRAGGGSSVAAWPAAGSMDTEFSLPRPALRNP